MKKILIILGLAVFLLLTAVVIAPLILRPQLINLVKKEAAKNLDATLDFESVGLNLYENFPNISLSIKNLKLINSSPPFTGNTLAHIANFKSTLSLMSLLTGKTVRVVSMVFDAPQIQLTTWQDGKCNWNILKVSQQQKSESGAPAKNDFNLTLQDYEIKDGAVLYKDLSSGLQVVADHLDHKGHGDFALDHFQLATSTKIRELSVVVGGVHYLSKMATQLIAELDVNMSEKRLVFKESKLQFNQLLLLFDGMITMSGAEARVDVKFKTNQNDLKNLFSLIPAVYNRNMADIKTSGQATVQGYILGSFKKDFYPAFHLQLSIADGLFQYAPSSTLINHITMELVLHNPGGLLDNTSMSLEKCRAEINQRPFAATLQVKTPVSDPYVSATVKGEINLFDISNIMPSEKGAELAGFISSDLFVAGNLSSIEKKQSGQFTAIGHLSFKEINYRGPAMPVPVAVRQADLVCAPEKVSLNNFQALLGTGDIRANGSLDNVWSFVLTGQPLKGRLTVQSDFFDANPWMAGPSRLSAIELPANLDFTITSTFKEVLAGKLKMANVAGLLIVKDKMLHLIDLKMEALNGSLIANGTYQKLADTPAHSFFDFKIAGFSISETFQNFLTVQEFAPMAKNIQGEFGAHVELVTDFDSTLTPVFRTLTSRGSLIVQKALVENFKPLAVLADILKMEKLRKFVVKNIEPSYTIRDGRLYFAPLNFKIDNVELLVAGSNGMDRSMDYLVKLKIPAQELGPANDVINNLFNKKLNLLQEDHVLLDVAFKGTVDKPDVQVSGRDILKGATDQLIDIARQEWLKQTVILPDTVRTEIEKRKLLLDRLKNIIKANKVI